MVRELETFDFFANPLGWAGFGLNAYRRILRLLLFHAAGLRPFFNSSSVRSRVLLARFTLQRVRAGPGLQTCRFPDWQCTADRKDRWRVPLPR